MTNSAVLLDVSKCVGCGSCTVACKLWNNLDYDPGVEGNAHGFDVELDDDTWTTVNYHNVTNSKGEGVLRFAKRQCMHCLEPACVSVCFAKALGVSETGAVVYDPKRCTGCRYCMLACPYDIPKYEWDEVFPSVMKCQFCDSKIAVGEGPACVSSCPTGALTYGDRDELLAKAHEIIAQDSSYVQQVMGESEAGGGRWLVISDTDFAQLGFPTNVPEQPINNYLHNYLKWTPTVFLGGGALFAGLMWYNRRREKAADAQKGGKA